METKNTLSTMNTNETPEQTIDMQTIKVTIGKTEYGAALCTEGGCFIAAVGKDFNFKGRYAGQFLHFASCCDRTFADAILYICDAIVDHFATFGLNVEFVNE